jgi:hypothetical protein
MNKYPVLSYEEEQELGRIIKNKDKDPIAAEKARENSMQSTVFIPDFSMSIIFF